MGCGVLSNNRPVLLAFFCLLVAVSSCSKNQDTNTSSILIVEGRTMGTTYSVKALVDTHSRHTQLTLADEIDKALDKYNMVMSTYIDESEISQLNREQQGKWLVLSDDMREILELSLDVSRESKGAFDITIGPLVNLWGFGPEKPSSFPVDEEVASVRSAIGYQNIRLDGNRLKKTKSVYLDLSAVAKGHATDVIAQILEGNNIFDYMVEIGGELKIRGNNDKGKVWTIGIEKPALGREGALQAVSGNNIAIATSGEYRNYYEENGVRVSHTIDPTTGYPINHSLASVTVIAEKGGEADAYATAINVLGPEKGYKLAKRKNLAAFFIVREKGSFNVKHTPEFEQYMVK